MTWLFVLFTPGLLMVATFGLSHLERHLDDGRTPADDVTVFLRESGAPDEPPRTPAAALRRPEHRIEGSLQAIIEAADSGDGYRRVPASAHANPKFRPTRHPDPV